MLKGLSPRAHKTISVFAQEEGRKYGSDQLLPEHVLIAILKSADGLAYSVLQRLKINVLTLQIALEQAIPPRSVSISFADIPPSNRLKKMIDNAAVEAHSLGHNYIGTEHLLLAAVNEKQSVMHSFFEKAQIGFEQVKNAVIQIETIEPSSASEKKTKVFAPETVSRASMQPAYSASQQQNQKQPHSILKDFCRDLTALAREGKIDPVIGRDVEIQRLIQILSRRSKNNPVLVGEPGVGKTAIVEGLALRIVTENIPRVMLKKRLLTLDLGQVIAGTKYRGEFEERIKRIMKEITEQKDIILFIDELHTLIGAGGAEGTMDASNMLKPALSRGELQCIGATTVKEYRKYFERDAALERRFQIIQVEEPNEEQTQLILEGLKKQYEDYHGVRYEDNVIQTIVRFAKRYITERFLPDKAIDLLDESGAMKKIKNDVRPPELLELEESIIALNEEKQHLVQTQNYERCAEIRDEVRTLRQKLEMFRDYWQSDKSIQHKVTVQDVSSVLSAMTGIPPENLNTADTGKLLNMEKELHKTVAGQDEAVRLVTSAVRRSRAGVSSAKRPQGSFIFLGPTGVGKTLLAKALAKFLFGTEEALIRIDMSDFMEKHNASRLVGAPPGYIGYEEGGLLTEKVRRNPYSVVLLDEIEKAHPEIFNLLLQLLEEGELRDSLGHTVNFRNTVIIMTSNAGARQISNENRLGFNTLTDGLMQYEEIKSNALNELKKILSPELVNRVDDIVVFTPLSKEQVDAVLTMQLSELKNRLNERGLELKIRPKARDYLIQNGYDPVFGARPMRRLIQREIEDKLAVSIISGETEHCSTVIVDVKNEKISIRFQTNKKNTLVLTQVT